MLTILSTKEARPNLYQYLTQSFNIYISTVCFAPSAAACQCCGDLSLLLWRTIHIRASKNCKNRANTVTYARYSIICFLRRFWIRTSRVMEARIRPIEMNDGHSCRSPGSYTSRRSSKPSKMLLGITLKLSLRKISRAMRLRRPFAKSQSVMIKV